MAYLVYRETARNTLQGTHLRGITVVIPVKNSPFLREAHGILDALLDLVELWVILEEVSKRVKSASAEEIPPTIDLANKLHKYDQQMKT